MPRGDTKSEVWKNADNVELLKRLYEAGYSCSQISARIPGTTRNAIIGKLHRMGLSNTRPMSLKIKKPRHDKGVRKVPLHAGSQRLKGQNGISWCKSQIPYQEITVMPVADDPCEPLHPRSFHDLDDDMCRWPLYVEQGVQMFCAAHIDQPRTPYCRTHCSASTAALRPRTNRVYIPHRGLRT